MSQSENATNQAVGKPINRVDGRLKVTGGARYSAEIPLENLAYAVTIGSAIARGRIKSIDTRAAEQSPGVLGILTHLNPPKLRPVPTLFGGGAAAENRLVLQEAVVHHIGQHIGVVIADTLENATHAASLVRVDYDAETPVVEMEKAQTYAPKSVFGKPPETIRGNPTQALADAEVRIEETYRTPTEHHNPMETHATTAVWEGDRLTIYDATQYNFGVRQAMATTFGIPEENVRVVCQFIGGAFGGKGLVWPHVTLAAIAARQVRRPVKLVLTREQMFTTVGHRAETEQQVALGATRDGRLTAIAHRGISHTSTFEEFLEPYTVGTHMMYATPNLQAKQSLVRLNKGTPTFMRAPGESPGMFALESAMDELAYALKLDPIELRLRNHADTDPSNNLPWSSKSLKECYQLGAEKFGWSRRTPEPGSMRDGRYLIGMGMASATYPVNHFPASARVRILQDGTALVQSGSQEMGTGTATVMAQVAADALGLPVERVRFELGDTQLPRAPISGGSATMGSVGTAVHEAAQAARRKVLELARTDASSPLYNVPETDIAIEGGRLFRKSDRNQGETYQAVLTRQNLPQVEESFDAKFNQAEKKYSMHSFGAQFAEVRVDPDFGEVRVTRFVGAFGVGQVINLKTARSQMIGGIVMGLGMALLEETVTDSRTGRIVNANLGEYHVPVNADIPAIESYFVEEIDPYINPIGAKGAGEIGITGVAAAVANAVYHATGKRIRDLPITPDKLL
ncbi:xanthine dehydrogenase family protein molybdopterin-binding subunit [Coleofasciculus sp. FACHB-542]|uniref:xanthine dehydrogenase family protein molybdopterin-binding subunit n=1 Tax=Coleofasciculus sp. FACHB-542 TaxID=2692787 RepID=UPI001685FE28|nr:xanthine dehydrogenase family protein molybdopterin-binding subunit [Coleofasciculus sp. FACHB-542]MBD2084166.1 xanthine dehydrogenase family protein molybdopterin-binding subunit [Coleofasciculus sp. FACHB-542]